MKKVFLLALLSLVIISCSVGDDTDRNFNLLPVFQVDVPTTFKVDSISIFKVRYNIITRK